MQALDLPHISSSSWYKIATPYARAAARRQKPQPVALAVLSKLPDATGFAAWRGRSGRRYVVTRHELEDELVTTWQNAIVIAIQHCNVSDQSTIIDLYNCGSSDLADAGYKIWLTHMKLAGATDLDVHLRLGDPDLRAIAMMDLAP
jgi:hypothetical protein